MSIVLHRFLTGIFALVCLSPGGMGWAAGPVALVLVASPAVTDGNFSKTVVLVTRTPANETVGVILNRRLRAGTEPAPLPENVHEMYFGGPVTPRGLLAIGTSAAVPVPPGGGPAGAGNATIAILPGLDLVIGPAQVRALLRAPGSRRVKVFAGYAGWGPEQLEREIAAGHWKVMPASEDLVFDADPATQWDRLSVRLRAVRWSPGSVPPGVGRAGAAARRPL